MSGTTSGTTATHDPLCMIPKVGGFFRMGGAIFPPVVDGDCAMCDFIIEVREDTLTKCIAVAEDQHMYMSSHSQIIVGFDVAKSQILRALRALQEKP
jgi:hypothetical protein